MSPGLKTKKLKICRCGGLLDGAVGGGRTHGDRKGRLGDPGQATTEDKRSRTCCCWEGVCS